MKKRLVILVGSLGILSAVWTLTWDKYQESLESSDSAGEVKSGPKKSSKPPVYLRLPADKNKPLPRKSKSKEEAIKTSFFKDKAVKRSPSSFRPSNHRVFKSGNNNFSVVEELAAVPAKERSSYDAEDIVGEKYNYLLVKKTVSLEGKNLVVQNQRTKRLGILTGVFKIKLKDFEDWSEVQRKYGLEKQVNFPGIRLALLKTNNLEEIEALLSQINKDSMVERVELEILESQPVTN